MSADQIAEQFLNHYYGTFSSNRAALQSLYQQDSTLTFEGEQYTGTQVDCRKICGVAIPTNPVPGGHERYPNGYKPELSVDICERHT